MRVGALAGLGIMLLLPAFVSAQVYRWEDQQGTLYYSNIPDTIPGSHRSAVEPFPDAPARTADAEDPSVSSAFARSRATTRIPYTPGDPIFVSATIGGTGPLTLILDTGADRTMVAPQALSRLGISLANAIRAQIIGVTGTGHAPVVQVASLEVGDARVGALRIIAHDADLQKADGLLGRDFLEQFTVTIDSREQVVILVAR
jgi:hypothetical protein